MNRYIITAIVVIIILGCDSRKEASKGEWITLFNGKDINDWVVKIHHHEVGENFGDTFRVEDGMIQVRYDQYGDFNDQFAHLYYEQPFHTSILLSNIGLRASFKKARLTILC